MPEEKAVLECDLDPDFLYQVYKLPGGKEIKNCIQCGTCTGSCPMGSDMDYAPRKIFAMIRAGMKDEVLSSNTIWYCSSCYSCYVRCPKDIKITDIMYGLKRMALKEGKIKGGKRASILSKNFVGLVNKYGRNHETELMTRYILQAEPFNALHFAPQGWYLFSNGRLPILPHRIKNLKQLKSIIDKAEELGEY